MSVNKVILIGNLGAKPELRYTANGQAVATFRIATNERWTSKNGEKGERTEWHRIVAWAKLGEICGQYLDKGKQVYVEGRIQTREWQDKEGQKRYTTEIVASDMRMLGQRGERVEFEGGGASGGPGGPDERVPAGVPADEFGGDMAGGSDDDLPF